MVGSLETIFKTNTQKKERKKENKIMQISRYPRKSNVCKIFLFIQERMVNSHPAISKGRAKKKLYSILFITQGHLNGF